MPDDRIRDVATMIAASKCLLSREGQPFRMPSVHRGASRIDVEGRPPEYIPGEPCHFCQIGTDYLSAMIDDAQRWVDYNNGAPISDFARLSPTEQTRRVDAAMYPEAVSA